MKKIIFILYLFIAGAISISADIYEPNNSAKEARIINPGKFKNLDITTDDKDYFKFDIKEDNSNLKLMVNFDKNQGALEFTLFRKNQEKITQNN